MKWMSFAEARAKLAQAIDASQEEDVVILVRGKPAVRLVVVQGETIDDLVRREQEIVPLLRERQRRPGKSIPLEAGSAPPTDHRRLASARRNLGRACRSLQGRGSHRRSACRALSSHGLGGAATPQRRP